MNKRNYGIIIWNAIGAVICGFGACAYASDVIKEIRNR